MSTAAPRGELTLEQLDVALDRFIDELETALEAGNEPRAGLLLELTQALESKREDVIDGVVRRLVYLESQVDAAKAQVDLYRAAQQRLENAYDKIRIHIQNYIDQHCPPDNPKLTGKVLWLRTQQNSVASLYVYNEPAVPASYRGTPLKVMLPASVAPDFRETLQAFLDNFAPGARIEKLDDPEVDTASLRAALDAGLKVDGARLERGRHLRFSKPKKSKAESLPDAAPVLPQP